MSYLNVPRLTFSGLFQADPSTVNNDPTHFDNATFQPNYQEWGPGATNGWWNPEGTGSWRFIGCTIMSVTYKDGTTTTDPKVDPVIGMSIMDANTRVAGKLVDLDPQQQGVSAIWGLVVRIVADGCDVMKGNYETAAFTNIFGRVPNLNGFAAFSASYQSVIKDIVWDMGKQKSRYLTELMEASPDQLSIEFNVDRYNGDRTSAQFTLGRMVGSIGPSSATEPEHFVPGRQLFPQGATCNFATAIVDQDLKTLTLDLGNALQFDTSGKVAETRQLTLAINTDTSGGLELVTIGNIDYSAPGWYEVDAGISTFTLSGDVLDQVNKFPLVIVSLETVPKVVRAVSPTNNIVFQEQAEYVCADQFVFRLNPGESCEVDFYATNLGTLTPGVTVELELNSTMMGPSPPPFGVPENVLTFPPSVPTGLDGKASIQISAGDPGNKRGYIDGQIYGIIYYPSDQTFANCNQSNFLSILVFDSVPEATINNPTWNDIQPIMQQYANLYPLMSKGIFNLADQTAVDANAEILKFVFSKDKTDPNYMPATRDLSRDKQQMIINYLDGVLKAQGPIESVTSRKI